MRGSCIISTKLAFQLEQVADKIWKFCFEQMKIHQNPFEHGIFSICLTLNSNNKFILDKQVLIYRKPIVVAFHVG